MASLPGYVSVLKAFKGDPLKIPVFSTACTCTCELPEIEVFPDMSQRPAGAFHPGVLAGPVMLVEHAFERAVADILGYKVAKHCICSGECPAQDSGALGA